MSMETPGAMSAGGLLDGVGTATAAAIGAVAGDNASVADANSTAAIAGAAASVPSYCFKTMSAAEANLPQGGWFSYIIGTEVRGYHCAKTYGFFHWLFAGILAIMSVLALVTSFCIIFIFVRRRLKSCFGKDKGKAVMDCPSVPITAVIPCYLPNEQFIIEETISWIMHKVESPGDFTIFVVYNTPKDLPEIEARLREMQASTDWPHGRRFKTLRVMDSKSKAANLNAALEQVKDPYVIIYDADHHPDRQSLMLLYEKMVRLKQDCVQGSYYMRNLRTNQWGCNPCQFPFLSRIIDAEFFTDWFFMKLVTRTFFMGQAYFSGSNALWRTEVLRSKQFSVTAQTEDVDMAIQQLLEGRNIEFCAESRSGELAPMGLCACWKQRLRWTMGWDETSLKHGRAFTERGTLNCRARCGMCWTFIIRWCLMMLSVGAVWVGFPLTMIWPLNADNWGKLITVLGRICFIAGCGPWFFATMEAILQVHHRGRQSAIQVLFVFLVSSPCGFASFFIFNFLQQIVSCWKICTGTVSGWEVTQRGPAEGIGWSAHEESSGELLLDPSTDDGEFGSSDEEDSDLENGSHGGAS